MLRRRRLWVVLTALVLSTIWWARDQSDRAKTRRALSGPKSVGASSLSRETPTLPPANPRLYAELNSVATPPANDLKIVESLVVNALAFSHEAHQPTLELNEDITRALTGANPEGIVLLPSDHPAIDGQGRLCDRWGTPYSFHPLSTATIEIRSAGPDRKFFTNDDLQWPRPPASEGINRERLTGNE